MAEVLRLYPPVLVFLSHFYNLSHVDFDVCAAVRSIAGIYPEVFLSFSPVS